MTNYFSAVFVIGLVTFADASTKYCAIFDKASSGASGYFGIEIFNNTAYYSYSLDLSNFQSTNCDLDVGLNYYLTTKWTASAGSSSTCDLNAVGGHYDPTLACSPESVHAVRSPNVCALLNRTSNSFRYTCNQKVMNHKSYGFCEIGDLSGKFGMAFPTRGDSAKFEQDELLVDYHPPYDAYYGSKLVGYVNGWASVTFSCLGGGNVVCAKVQPYKASMNRTCSFPSIYFPTSAPTGLTPYWQNVVHNDNNAAICLIVISVAVIFAIYLYLYIQFRAEKAKEDAERASYASLKTTEKDVEVVVPAAVHH